MTCRPGLCLILGLCWVACTGPASRQHRVLKNQDKASAELTGYTWNKLTDSAQWARSYNYQMISLRDTLWVFHPAGIWFTTDAAEWHPSPLPNAIGNLAFLDYIAWKDAVYGLGYLEGNIERYTFTSAVFRTREMHHWDTVASISQLPERFFYHPFIFDNQIWIIGGEDRNGKYADIWQSPDGIQWAQKGNRLPFGERSNSQIVALNDSLYLLNNDVWSSSDGLHWHLVTEEIVPGEQVFGYTALVFDRKIWLLGCNRNGQFSSQVLVSADGKSWTSMQAPWSPRGGIAAAAHKGKIYMTGGKYGGTPDHTEFIYSNDIWVLTKE